jgi:hypothetical protein
VTAEMAVALPVLMLVLWGCLWAVMVVAAQARCAEISRVAARAAARGDDPARSVGALLPSRTTVSSSRSGEWVTVQVSGTVPVPGALTGWMPSVAVHAQSVAAAEPTLADTG